MLKRRRMPHGARLLAVLLVLSACQPSEPSPSEPSPSEASDLASSGRVEPPSVEPKILTLGDVEPDNPVKRTRQHRPEADYLVANLDDLGITEVRILIAKSVDEMARHLTDGTVDVYIDSPFPVLGARARSGAKVILQRWWRGSRKQYWSVFITRPDSGVSNLLQLRGRVIAFESETSTSGFLLPAAHLAKQGLTIRGVGSAEADVAAHEIGYIFSGDEENSMALVLGGVVPVGAISNEDYDELPPAYEAKVRVLEPTESTPRQLVAVRPDLDRALVEGIRRSLLARAESEEHQVSPGDPPARSWEYGELTSETESLLSWLEEQMASLVMNRVP